MTQNTQKHLTCQEEEEKNHDESVSEVEESRRCIFYVQFGDEVVDAVEKEVDGRETTGQETSPPPVIVLTTTKTSYESINTI